MSHASATVSVPARMTPQAPARPFLVVELPDHAFGSTALFTLCAAPSPAVPGAASFTLCAGPPPTGFASAAAFAGVEGDAVGGAWI
ncbi:hypothetical protein AB0G79_14830 [Streptomyces sp. NPDC020807]|uniref:hypothetical protein n=1 Tax=Streptomyces sp. NPDC020807 TaxID=3155119 RepID=UPI0033C4BA4A